MKITIFKGLCAFALMGLMASCGVEPPAIDRVQPNYIDKDYLVGEWYYQRTVVDVPAARGFTFVGNTDHAGMTRVKWDLQEGFLYARRQTELLKGADLFDANGDEYEGEIVASFAISSHFDIQRTYNPNTGEENNVLVENTQDRPWYDRQYVRVDWSKNLVSNYSLDFEAQSVEPVAYFVQEIDPNTGERHRHAPVFEEGYFDVTNKLIAEPDSLEIWWYDGKIPMCWLRDFTECGSSEYTIRHSFKQIDKNHTYDAVPYKGKPTETFGYFTTERQVYDPVEGIRHQGTERYLNRHNIWIRSTELDGTPIPYSARLAKPIVYHVNREWPVDDVTINEAAREVAEQWNSTFVDVVNGAGATLPDDGRMFVLCENNPVKAGDHAACGAAGTSPRIGDLRYSFMAYIPGYMTYGLLGLGPSNNDPETGEIISGMGYVYHHNNLAAFRVLEMVELLAGITDANSYIEGEDLTNWVDKVQSGNSQSRHIYSLADTAEMVEQISNGPANAYWEGRRREVTAEDEAYQREHGTEKWLQPVLQDLRAREFNTSRGDVASAKLATLAGTDIEEMMLNDDMYRAMGVDPDLMNLPEVKSQVSVLRGGFVEFAERKQELFEKLSAERNMYFEGMADDGLMGLAREIAARQNYSSEETFEEIRKSVFTAVLAHEVGHSLGLMHNFGGSDDAINYFDKYWELRSADGTVQPRLVDPISEQEVDGRIYNEAYSSVMDYAGKLTIDGNGIGKYDRAAVMFGYAEKVEVFEDNHGIDASTFRDWHESDGDMITFWNAGPEATHYTHFYNEMGEDLYSDSNRRLVDVADLSDDFSTDSQGRARVPYIYCSHNRADLGDNCLTRDFGADSAERMQNMLNDLDTWYIMRSFPRGQIGSDNYNYVGRYYGRIYRRLKQWHDVYGLYKDFLPEYYSPAQLSAFYSDPTTGWGTKTWAIQNAFNTLVGTILMPEVGSYATTVNADGSSGLSPSFGTPVSLDVTEGRYYQTSWQSDRNCGYMWWECLHHVGFYLDKVMAVYALSDSNTNFVGRSTPEDLREWEVGYYNTFGPQISKISQAIMAQDWSEVSPYMDGGEVRFPNYAGNLDTVHPEPVNPQATFTVQLYWQVLGRARFVSTFDQGFDQESDVFIMGTASAPEVEAERLVTFKDPFSARTFGAVGYDGKGAGEAVINRANALLARSNYCDDVAGTVGTADDCVAPPAGFSRTAEDVELASHVELLQSMAKIRSYMDWGNPFSP